MVKSYDIILGISTYYTKSYVIYIFMMSYLYVSGALDIIPVRQYGFNMCRIRLLKRRKR